MSRRTVIGLVAAAIVVWWFWDAIVAAWVAVSSLPSQVGVPLGVAVFTTFGSVLAVVYAKRQEHRREIAQQQRVEKATVYKEFMDYWFRYFREPDPALSEDEKQEQDEQARVTYYATVPQKLVLWASESVVKEHKKYLRPDRTETVKMTEFEKVLFALRKDLGYSNEGLQKGDLLHLFLKGVEDYLREEKHQSRGPARPRP